MREARVAYGVRTAAIWAAFATLGCSDGTDRPEEGPLGEVTENVTLADVSFDVSLRGSGTVTIHASIFDNPMRRVGITLLAVHGFAGTGYAFGPLSEAIFDDPYLKRGVRRVIGVDMPGHGDSGFPTGLPGDARFGDLTIDDNVDVVLQSIGALRSAGLAPQVILGHSMGGLVVQAAQQELLSAGSSLAELGIHGALLMAPVPPHGLPWTVSSGDLSPFVVSDPVLGNFVSLPPPVWIAFAFATPSGGIVANAPTVEEVVANEYSGIEPLTTALQLLETPVTLPGGGTVTLERPTVGPGIFDINKGTAMALVSFSEDVLVPPTDLEGLYEYLSGDPEGTLYEPVSSPDAVHTMTISNPTGLIDSLRSML